MRKRKLPSSELRALSPPLVDTGGVVILDRAGNVETSPGAAGMQTNTLGNATFNDEEVMRRVMVAYRLCDTGWHHCITLPEL